MVSIEDVRRHLDPDEPDYLAAAEELGPAALPTLAELVGGEDTMLAAKAVSLAGVIGGDDAGPVVTLAASERQPEEVRLFAARAAGRLGRAGEAVLSDLLTDPDAGVRRYAVAAVPATASKRLRDRLRDVAVNEQNEGIRRQMDAKVRDLRPLN